MANVRESEELLDSFLKLRDLGRSVKLDLRISCKMGLFLAMAVEQSLLWNDPANLMQRVVADEDRAKLQEVAEDILKKAEAEEFYGLVKKIVMR